MISEKFYQLFLVIHIASVVTSVTLFVLRGMWMMQQSPVLARRWVRIVPHVSDTVLIISATVLMFIINQFPFRNDWLTVKLMLLPVYIVFGLFAINHGRSRWSRSVNGAVALAVVVYIVMVAVTRQPLPLL